MNTRFIDWIWHVRGSLALSPQMSPADAFDRLDPLFHTTGTSHERTSDRLVFRKKDPAAQDRMAVFENGVLQVEKAAGGPVLHYHLISRSLLLCFLAPLLFLGFAQLNIALAKFDKPAAAASAKPGAGKAADKQAKKADVPMNPIDKWLGAPAPEKKDADKSEDKGKKKHSPTPAYVFAGIFAALYLVGRILEDRLVKSLFRKRLMAA
ncbi:MAG: hypothetical protein KGM17_00305 [Sphingomonadales bacterium]|nr:hypothetical protein [Sphingomonadales bacterium]